jgi:hypothetical protein
VYGRDSSFLVTLFVDKKPLGLVFGSTLSVVERPLGLVFGMFRSARAIESWTLLAYGRDLSFVTLSIDTKALGLVFRAVACLLSPQERAINFSGV